MKVIERSTTNTAGLDRIDLFEEPEGIYIFVYEAGSPTSPARDFLQDTWEVARAQCQEEFGVPLESWQRISVETSPY